MLVLTRKTQETVQIGPDVTITILRIKGNQVQVGIKAPREVRVLRGELPPEERTARADASHDREPRSDATPEASAGPLAERIRHRGLAAAGEPTGRVAATYASEINRLALVAATGVDF